MKLAPERGWKINRSWEAWRWLVRMARDRDADLAHLQEVGSPPVDLADRIGYRGGVFWSRQLYDRWPLVVKLCDRVTVEPYQQVPPVRDLGEDAIGASGIATVAAARVIPHDDEDEAFVAVSMYECCLSPHPSINAKSCRSDYSDASAHRIISDQSTFIGRSDPAVQRILAAGDLNMFYGATGRRWSLPERGRKVWNRMQALGLEFLGPQVPHGRRAEAEPDDVRADTENVPTWHYRGTGPEGAKNQLDYVFASRGIHKNARDSQERAGFTRRCRSAR